MKAVLHYEFSGCVVLVTGAVGGIRSAVADAFARAGAGWRVGI